MATHSLWTCLVATVGLLWGVTVLVSCNEESKLIGDLFRGYNKSICPAVHPTDKVEVQVKLILTNIISLRTWAIKHSPARKLINSRYTPDDLEYQEISFNLVIQREPLFYIINIILPCSLISLVVLAYLLPAQDWGQKLTVSISVLLAQTVFLFLIAQKDPETSLNVPLISKYLIFVMSVTTLIATNQIVVGTSPSAVPIPTPCPTQHLFLELVPQFLGMAPLVDNAEAGVRERRRSSFFGLMQRAEEYVLKQPRSEMVIDKQRGMASHDHLWMAL